MSSEYAKFQGKIYYVGDSLVITIPSPIAKMEGYKIGDELKVMTRKATPTKKPLTKNKVKQ